MKPAIFLAEARQEMNRAASFYESRSPGLGAGFLTAIEQAIADIREHPRRWPMVRSQTRRRLLGRFPYGILYRDDPNEIVVLAVMHLHRNPSYWIDHK
jgi:plasmid stabilization system protein ParE